MLQKCQLSGVCGPKANTGCLGNTYQRAGGASLALKNS